MSKRFTRSTHLILLFKASTLIIGITVKAQTASMFFEFNGEEYLLNLIDTPVK